MNALPKCTRTTLIILGLCLVMAGPAMLLWASRVQRIDAAGDSLDARMDRIEIDKISHLQLPAGTARPEAFSPFGQAFKNGPARVPGDAKGMLRMNVGDLNPKQADALLTKLPAELRLGDKEKTALGAKGSLAHGLNYAMLSESAVAAKSLDAVLQGIRADARVVGYGPNSTLLLFVDSGKIGQLKQNPDVAFFQAMPPGDKIALDTARRPLIEKARATDPNLLLEVSVVPGSAAAAVREAIAKVPGVVDVADFGPDGSAYLVRAEYKSLGKLARVREVLNIQESLEMMSANAKNAPSMQVGSASETNQARPFDDIGVDGGGIDTNGDGQRINNGTDAVPPQIVGVLDNGISADTPNYSQTATQVTDITHPFGPAHRKIHSIVNVRGDNGADCDSVLDGAGSHGNVVAGVIAAAPSRVGVFATRSGVGAGEQPRNANLDGVARGARIIVSDIADRTRCTINSLVERGGNVDPGSLATRLGELICPNSGGTGICTGIVGGAAEVHLAITPFGAPDNFSTIQFQLSDGTYPQQSADIDTFLYNNRDFLVFGPAGNSGVLISTSRPEFWTPRVIPDFFDGTDTDDCIPPPTGTCNPGTYTPRPIQIPPPSTAKNIVTVGVTRSDEFTTFAEFDNMANMATFSSRGPASPESLRMAPIVVAPGSDLIGPLGPFETASMAVFRSRDNDNAAPVDAQIDEGNFGTSFAAAAVTGAAAIVRDYYAQGFYPTGDRNTANRVPNVSGALVKASLVASARFTTNIRTPGETGKTTTDKVLRRTRSTDVGTIQGHNIGVLGNSEQGYGRVNLANVLPISSWSKQFRQGGVSPEGARWTAGNTPPGSAHWEYPAAGLLAWDDIATGEPAIDNTTTSKTHTFRLASANTVIAAGGGTVASIGQLRVGLAWTDPPSLPGTGGPLVNDLDMVVEGPGPDNCLFPGDIRPDGATCAAGTAADNQFFDGNNYPGTQNPFADQWSKLRTVGQPEVHDRRNPQEAVHLSFDRNNDTSAADSQLYLGTWRVTVKRGLGGSTPGSITITGPNEDLGSPGNRRLDAGEDTNGNGLLDLGGQTYALVVSGPVYLAEAAPARGPSLFPSSAITLDKVMYSCEDALVATIFDTTSGAGIARSRASTTFTARTLAGVVTDTETGVNFTAGLTAGSTNSSAVPIRVSPNPVPNNGILETDNGQLVFAVYAPAGQPPIAASGKVDCAPNFIPGFFAILGNNAIGPQTSVGGGCDDDVNLDAGETVTYGIALTNRGRNLLGSRSDDYADVVATLTASGPGAGAVTVLDSPRNVGRLPRGTVQGVYFHIAVNAAAANALPIASRQVTLTLSLDSLNKGRRLNQLSYAFTAVINADEQRLHYSTDLPGGGRNVRDLNRNLVIDRPDIIDPVKLVFLPDEDVTFSSLFTTIGPGSTVISNRLGEDLNDNGLLDSNEPDVIPNGVLDRGILFATTGPGTGDKVPWNFDNLDGGWVPIRHPQSTTGPADNPNPMWEYKTSGLCGYQTAGTGTTHYGIWHTGDGNLATPGAGATACDNFLVPHDIRTENKVELVFDVLISPVIAKVNQLPDARGFPYTVEYQRLGININDEVADAGYAAMGINIDNNLDVDSTNCFLCQELDAYYARGGGWPYLVFNTGTGQTFGGEGIGPDTTEPFQRTFGPFNDPNGGTPFNGGGETGYTGSISVPGRISPIPPALPDYQKFPQTGAPVPGVCTGGTTPGAPCQTSPQCPGGGTCALEQITIAGPIRNFEGTLVGFEGSFAVETQLGNAAPEDVLLGRMGPAGNRWGIGLGFFSIESSALLTDYGYGIDDVLFEWDESHPLDESAFSPAHTPACSRFNTPGNPAGGQCATITVDRTNLYECEEAVEITLVDPKISAPSVQVMIVTDSDADLFSTSRFTVLKPNAKRYTLLAVSGQPGLYRGTVTFSGTSNTANNVFTTPGGDSQFIVYYVDAGCDGDGDGQVAEDNFDNLDGDGVAFATDNCPLIYNPLQEDADADGIGNLCDNCVNAFNDDQADANADGVGDVCEYDDVDGDGVGNNGDNCADVFNPSQSGRCSTGGTVGNAGCQPTATCDPLDDCCTTSGATCDKTRGFACSNPAQDLDGDGRFDNADNCVLTSNNVQTNSDGDRLGDACDGDCPNLVVSRVCSNAPGTTCTVSSNCPAGGRCQSVVRHASGTCSSVDDDADLDGVDDPVDICPDISNPPIIPGTKRQLDTDRDGVGDACDPAGSQDDDFEGVPDDLVTFAGVVSCQELPLADFAILQTAYQDFDGDHDIFPDTGESGLVTVRIQNNGADMTGASFVLSSSDPNVGCITFPRIVVGNIPAGGIVTIGSLTPLQAGSSFTFRTSDSLQSTLGDTQFLNLCVTASSNEVLGGTTCFSLPADLDPPPPTEPQIFIDGPDGIAGTGDDGLLQETFDTDRGTCTGGPTPGKECATNANCGSGGTCSGLNGIFSSDDILRLGDLGTGVTSSAFFVHGSDTGVGPNVVAGIGCGGYATPAEGNEECRLDVDYPMDWHFHCPTTASNCPNTESGGFPGGIKSGCVGGCSYQTPADGARAFTAPNSLHLGAHFDTNTAAVGDTTHLRALQAVVSSPINLVLFKRDPGDLKLSFYQIVDLVDGNAVSGGVGLCHDCAQLQVQIDSDPNPAVDNWGTWNTLAPFQNVYDHQVRAWSTFGAIYCELTPTDTGTAPPAPRGVHETFCFNQRAWSHCGSAAGTGDTQTFQCADGVVDPGGKGVWVQTQFNLDTLLGQRVRIRWIATTWQFDDVTSSYFEYGTGWSDTPHDDGWWADNVEIVGVLKRQLSPVPDNRPAPPTACPATAADNCNEGAASTDKGTLPAIKVTDLQGVQFGISRSPVAGQAILVSAVDSSIPGGCSSGVAQFRFTKNGTLVQDWSSKAVYQDTALEYSPTYSVQVRCSSDTTCTSLTGASVKVAIYDGINTESDGGVTFASPLGVTYASGTQTTTLNVSGASLVDIYKGSITTLGTGNGFVALGPTWQHVATTCFQNNVAGNTNLALTQASDPNPSIGQVTFYVANAATPGVLNGALGNTQPDKCFSSTTAPNAVCFTSVTCGAGTCLSVNNVNSSASPASAEACKP